MSGNTPRPLAIRQLPTVELRRQAMQAYELAQGNPDEQARILAACQEMRRAEAPNPFDAPPKKK